MSKRTRFFKAIIGIGGICGIVLLSIAANLPSMPSWDLLIAFFFAAAASTAPLAEALMGTSISRKDLDELIRWLTVAVPEGHKQQMVLRILRNIY